MEPTPLARLLATALRLAVDEMHERLAEEGYDDLRPVHGYVLNAAAAEGGATASSLATMLGISKQATAKVVQELTALGYVHRGTAEGDARRRPVRLTPRGSDALAASVGIQRDLEAEWAEAAGGARLGVARRALESVLAAAAADGRSVPLRPTW